ncbi:zinc ribbon domain-containing protein, partial [Clostridioides difficile]|nr:zinc ribbon domain-containing protein [Clostridioides difficile]
VIYMSEDENKVSQENDSTKFCISCGEKLLEGQLFCSKCGKKVDEKTVISKKASINKNCWYNIDGHSGDFHQYQYQGKKTTRS